MLDATAALSPSRCPFGHDAPAPAREAVARAHGGRPVPEAPGLPVIGHMIDLLDQPLPFFLKASMTVGPVFRVRAPGRNDVVAAGLDATRALLEKDGGHLTHVPLYAGVRRELGSARYPIATEGDAHRHLRRSLAPVFSTDVLAPHVAAIAQGVEARLDAVRGAPVALDLMHALLGDVVVEALAGRALGRHLGDALRFARCSVGTGLGSYPPELRWSPRYLWSKRRMNAWFRDLLAARRARASEGATNFVDRVLACTDEQGAPLREQDLVALAQMIVSNTLLYVAPAAAFALYHLLRHPDALARCREELDAAWADGPPTLDALKGCAWFAASLQESMRLSPIGLAAPRVVTRGFTLDGCALEEGETVLFAITAAHYDPSLYPQPHRFDPARHLAPRSESAPLGALLPFGVGAHACVARRLVEGMLLTVVGAMVRSRELSLPPSSAVLRQRVNPFPEPTDALRLRVGPRRGAPGAAVTPPAVRAGCPIRRLLGLG